MAAKFDLETLQLNLVNAFMDSDIDKMVFMRMYLRYVQFGHVLKIHKALYELRRSNLPWQKKLTNKIKKLSFKEIPKES